MNRFIALLAAAFFCATTGAAFADDAATKKQMHDYVLSMDKIKALQAEKDEEKSLEKNPAFAKQVELGMLNGKTYGSMQDRLADIPPLAALYRKHGLTATDVVIMPAVLLSTGMAVVMPSLADKLSAQTSPAQIAFYKAHQAELKKIPFMSGGQ